MHNLDPTDWLLVFPEAREYLLPRIRQIETEIQATKTTIERLLRLTMDSRDSWFVREYIKAFHVNRLLDLKRECRRLNGYFPQNTSITTTRMGVDRNLIDRAKEYPIMQLAEGYIGEMRRSGKTYRALCPFHNERTPSFYLYPETNSYHCFGCLAHGDVISLAQKILNLGFIEAVKYLTKLI